VIVLPSFFYPVHITLYLLLAAAVQAHAVLRAIHASRAKKRRRDFSSTDKSAFT
jgi:multisubunit Na+/H+ antiporter MnhG subunit